MNYRHHLRAAPQLLQLLQSAESCNDGTPDPHPLRLAMGEQANRHAFVRAVIDRTNSSNIFRGSVTTNYGLDMTHSTCYAGQCTVRIGMCGSVG
jgi:hypothetical protein